MVTGLHTTGTQLRVGSLFTGYAGLDDGVNHVLGGETVWHAEIEPGPVRVLEHAFPGVPNLGDVTQVDWATVPAVDVLTGGSPCQDVSAAGRRAGMKAGTRSGLWAAMCDAISVLRPSLVVWENVKGVRHAEADCAVEHCPGCVGDPGAGGVVLRALGRVLGDLAELGYDTVWCSLQASDVGAPHGRERVFVFAWPADADTFGSRRDGWAHQPVRGTEGRTAPARGRANVHETRGSDTRGVISLLPTPRSSDGVNGSPNQSGSSGDLMLPSAVMRFLPTPRATESDESPATFRARTRSLQTKPGRAGGQTGPSLGVVAQELTRWHEYAPAIYRWEELFGPAPEPLEPNRAGNLRLSPVFSEWMMGIPAGRVTDPVLGLSRTEQLMCIGNGVVPAQASAATAWFMTVGYPAARAAARALQADVAPVVEQVS